MRSPALAALVAAASLAACAPPKLADAEDRAAERYCNRAVACDWVGDDDWDSCVDDMQDFFDLAWPDDTCDDRVDGDGWAQCLDAIEALDCDDWSRGLSEFGSCDAGTVCG